MTDKFTKLSRDDYETVQKAREQIAEAERRIVELIPQHLNLRAGADVDELNFTKLSRDDYDSVKKERHRIIEAERLIAKLVIDKLGITSCEDPSIQRIPLQTEGGSRTAGAEMQRSFEVIYCGCCDPCGVYVDPPGICAPI